MEFEPMCIGNGQANQSWGGASKLKNPGVVCIEGNGSRKSHKGPGFREGDYMYTLNTVEQHSVCYAIDQQDGNEGQYANDSDKFECFQNTGRGWWNQSNIGATVRCPT